MPDLLIKGLADETMQALSTKAQAAGKDRMAYVRDLLIQVAAEPLVKERYGIRFYNDAEPSRGLIRRFGNDPRQTTYGCDIVGVEAGQATEKALDLIRRNSPGDREEAIFLLKSHFDNVFEVAV